MPQGSLLGMMLSTAWCNDFNPDLGTKLLFVLFYFVF